MKDDGSQGTPLLAFLGKQLLKINFSPELKEYRFGGYHHHRGGGSGEWGGGLNCKSLIFPTFPEILWIVNYLRFGRRKWDRK